MNGATDFHKGLNKLEWQLGGLEQARDQDDARPDPAAPRLDESGEWW